MGISRWLPLAPRSKKDRTTRTTDALYAGLVLACPGVDLTAAGSAGSDHLREVAGRRAWSVFEAVEAEALSALPRKPFVLVMA